MMLFTFAMCVSLVKEGIHLLDKPDWLDLEDSEDTEDIEELASIPNGTELTY
ncbi:hypothetical protein [Maridesulfovibrio ferrireducens]|uniref:hypothetical protein n=1 Tax=Maridesulfovibrio ferrireducens TaxID=246191 RepID=UPI001A271D61|nr:hypothetical protein [Maridesulfovibrio ferrireducens]MBI9111082.1 hypothetical protein [Maridesulfovibrio ferrireducens]